MSEEKLLEIRSNEAGALLSIRRDGHEVPHEDLDDGYWTAAVSCGPLQAALRFYEIGLGGLDGYFAELATD